MTTALSSRLGLFFDKVINSFLDKKESLENSISKKTTRKGKIIITAVLLSVLFLASFGLSSINSYQQKEVSMNYYADGVLDIFGPVKDAMSDWWSNTKSDLGTTVSNAILTMITGGMGLVLFDGQLKLANLCIKYGVEAYNACCKHAVSLLTMSPISWADGTGYAIAKSIANIFQVTATVLLVIFFLIGLCDEALDTNKEIRLESVLRLIIKFSLAEFFIVNCFTITSGLFGIIDDIAPSIAISGDTFGFLIDTDLNYTFTNTGMWWGTFLVILGFIYFIVALASGFSIVFEAYFRFFKILILLPYGTIANATIAGTPAMRQSAIQFWKFALSVVLDAVTMLICLKLFSVIFDKVQIFTFTDTNMSTMISQLLFFFVTIGVIKGSSNLTKQALGI